MRDKTLYVSLEGLGRLLQDLARVAEEKAGTGEATPNPVTVQSWYFTPEYSSCIAVDLTEYQYKSLLDRDLEKKYQ